MLNRKPIIYSAFTLVTALSSVMVFAKDGERIINLQEDFTSVELIKLSIPAGEVRISGTTGHSLTAEISASCQPKKAKESCTKLLNELGWSRKTGATTELGLSPSGITQYDDMTIRIKISVPNDKKLDVNMSVGDLDINGTSACLTAEVNAGDLGITLKEAQLASAELNAKVGDVNLTTAKGEHTQGNRSLLVGANLQWNKGTGTCHTKASVLVGEVRLVLN